MPRSCDLGPDAPSKMREYTVNFPYDLSSYDWFRLHPYVITVTSCCDLPH